MAVRPIDANELYRIEKLLDTDIVRQDKVALNLLEQVLYDIQHVPTLTPPNEPLTWSELAEMEGQPVYIVEMGARRYWALVIYVDKDTAYFATLNDPDDHGDKELYGESWVAYRRPLDGEA